MYPKKPVPDPFTLLNQYVSVSREMTERLTLFHDLLTKWQNKINLISPDTIDDIWRRHILDSLQLLPLIADRRKAILDMGAGAGFPGLMLALTGCENVTLIESDTKKIAFLEEAARITNTTVSLEHRRIETCEEKHFDTVIARACSELGQLLEYGFPFLSHETICLFHKGKNYSKELEDAKMKWQFEHSIIPSVTSNEGVIVQLSKVRRRT